MQVSPAVLDWMQNYLAPRLQCCLDDGADAEDLESMVDEETDKIARRGCLSQADAGTLRTLCIAMLTETYHHA